MWGVLLISHIQNPHQFNQFFLSWVTPIFEAYPCQVESKYSHWVALSAYQSHHCRRPISLEENKPLSSGTTSQNIHFNSQSFIQQSHVEFFSFLIGFFQQPVKSSSLLKYFTKIKSYYKLRKLFTHHYPWIYLLLVYFEAHL